MHNRQLNLFSEGYSDDWNVALNVRNIVKLENPTRLEYAPCTVTSKINELGRLQFSCTCEKGQKEEVCDHVLRAIGGDIYLLSDHNDDVQRKSLIEIYRKCLTTDIYEAVCDYHDKRELVTQKTHELKQLLQKRDTSADDSSYNTEIAFLRKEGLALKAAEMSQHQCLSHLVMFSGAIIGSGEKIKNCLRVLESLLNKNNKRSIYLPLFLPELCEETGWYYEPRPCMATPLGLNAQERTRQTKRENSQKSIILRHMVRAQSNCFALSVGYTFFTPDRHYIQILNVQELVSGDASTQIIEFKRSVESASQTPSFGSLPVGDFIRLLITGCIR